MRLNCVCRTILTVALCLVSVLESTGNASIGNNLVIEGIGISQSGTIGWVFVSGTIGFGCTAPAGGSSQGFAFDYSTTKGKAILQVLTAAHLAGKRIKVTGDGTCIAVAQPMAPNNVFDSIVYLLVMD